MISINRNDKAKYTNIFVATIENGIRVVTQYSINDDELFEMLKGKAPALIIKDKERII